MDLELERHWAGFVEKYEPLLGSPAFIPIINTLQFLILSTICLILDSTRVAHKWKIQKNKYTAMKDVGIVMLTWTIQQLVFSITPTGIAIYTGVFSPIPKTLPTRKEFLTGFAVSFFLFDTLYFFWHWAHHKVPWLYRNFHALHHEYNAPFSYVAQYLNVGELIITSLFASAGQILLRPMHPLTIWIFFIVLVSASVEDHSGYIFPFSLSNWSFGLYGGPKAHDRHHVAFYGNYAPFLSFWDKIFGTEIPIKDKHVD